MAEPQPTQGQTLADIAAQTAQIQADFHQGVTTAREAIVDIAYTAHAIEDRFPENQAREREGELLYEQIYDPQGHAEMAERSQATIDRLWARHAAATQDTAPQTPAQAEAFQRWVDQPGRATEVRTSQSLEQHTDTNPLTAEVRGLLLARRLQMDKDAGESIAQRYGQSVGWTMPKSEGYER